MTDASETTSAPDGAVPTKIALIFRADLTEMTRGKSEIQAAHAGMEHALKVNDADRQLLLAYMATGQTKVGMEVDSEAHLRKIGDRAAARGVPCTLITDAGRTVFDGPTVTCVMVGPMNKTDNNALTRGARMRDRERQV